MAGQTEIKTKTFFQISPLDTPDTDKDLQRRVVFMNTGFDLDRVLKISEVYELRALQYVFFVHIGHTDDMKLEFEFKRKGDALMAQRELCRAWTKTGEFAE